MTYLSKIPTVLIVTNFFFTSLTVWNVMIWLCLKANFSIFSISFSLGYFNWVGLCCQYLSHKEAKEFGYDMHLTLIYLPNSHFFAVLTFLLIKPDVVFDHIGILQFFLTVIF